MTTIPKHLIAHQHRGLPGFVRGAILTASRGGVDGYRQAGYTLGRHIDAESPDTCENDEWHEILRDVEELLLPDHALLAQWIGATYPTIWQRVPLGRREQFIEGVRQGYVDHAAA